MSMPQQELVTIRTHLPDERKQQMRVILGQMIRQALTSTAQHQGATSRKDDEPGVQQTFPGFFLD